MNTIRMFAFATAVLMTALLFGVFADAFTSEPPIPGPAAVHGEASPDSR